MQLNWKANEWRQENRSGVVRLEEQALAQGHGVVNLDRRLSELYGFSLVRHEGIEGKNMSQELVEAITRFSKDDAVAITLDLLKGGASPEVILAAAKDAMQQIGDRFEAGEYFLPELVIGGDILGKVAKEVKPFLQGEDTAERIGTIVFGTVEGDIHDIAKDIVVMMLEVGGFKVIDLGVDVPAVRFVEAAKEHESTIVGLSGFLTLAIEPMKNTVHAFRDAGLTDVKIMIGGGPINELARADTGADAWGATAMDAVAIAKQWAGVSRDA